MKGKILIIDTYSAYISLIKKLLSNEGYGVEICENENEINSYLKNHLPDIILIDVLLSNGKGFDILVHLKSKYSLIAPVIIISEGRNIETIERAFKSGAYDYLIKPINIKDLRNKIISALNKNNCHV